MHDPGGVLVVPLRAGPRVCNLSSSFHLHLAQYSTSVATNYIYKISSMVHFDLRPSRTPKCTRFLQIHHILFLSQFNLLSHCLVPWTPLATIITSYTKSQQRLANTSHNTQLLWPQTTFLKSPGRFTLIRSPLVSLHRLVVSKHTISSSFPTLTILLVSLPPGLHHLAHYFCHLKALNNVFLIHLRLS